MVAADPAAAGLDARSNTHTDRERTDGGTDPSTCSQQVIVGKGNIKT